MADLALRFFRLQRVKNASSRGLVPRLEAPAGSDAPTRNRSGAVALTHDHALRSAASSASATAAVMVRIRHSTDSIGLVGCDTLIETGTASATSASHLLIDDGGTGTAGDVGLDGCTFSWQGSAPRTQDVLVTGSSHATIELADVTCAPYGCVEVTAVAPASPVVTATGTTVLC